MNNELTALRKALIRHYWTMTRHAPGSPPYQRAWMGASRVLYLIELLKGEQ